MANYTEDQMLMLSGIQHYVFCPRQWALIYLDQQWKDNVLTLEGHLLHSRVDDPTTRILNNGVVTLRRVSVASHSLGLYGICDAVELIPVADNQKGILHPRYGGPFLPIPIEYKHGHTKVEHSDRLQVVAQAMSLEEMYDVEIPEGYIFYWETRRRERVIIDEPMRKLADEMSHEMHNIFDSKLLPSAEAGAKCKRCSLVDLCLPNLNSHGASGYLRSNLYA